MNKIKEFEKLIIEEKDIIPFLKKLTSDDKKSLVKTIIKLRRKYSKIIEYKPDHYKDFGTQTQNDNLEIAGFVCLNYKDFKSTFWRIDRIIFEKKILEWHRPKWINDFINNEGVILSYFELLRYSKKGFLSPSQELYANKLQDTVYEYSKSNGSKIDIIQFLKSDEIILKEHFWYLFQYETEIHFSEGYGLHRGRIKKEENWYFTIQTLLQNGNLNRKRVLKEAFLTATRNFNKSLTGWFFNLVLFLKPTNDELIDLQEYIFLALNTNHSKPINTSLRFIKSICLNKQFETNKFIEISGLLLSSKYKSIVKNTLIILDKIAKNNSSLHHDISVLAAIALMSSDVEIQLKTIKLIGKYGDPNSQMLLEKLNEYGNDLYSIAKSELEKMNFHLSKDVNLINNYNTNTHKICLKNSISSLHTFEELVFFYSQAFENNEIYHFDLFVAYFPELNREINEENIFKLEPAFQRACKVLGKDLSNGKIGYIEKIMAIFFINYFSVLISKFPKETLSIKKIYVKHFGENMLSDEKDINRYSKIDVFSLIPKGTIYDHYIYLLERINNMLEKSVYEPVLSTLTHSPCLISEDILIEKISRYSYSSINKFDFQIAISRLVIDKNEDILLSINEKLTGEIKEIFLYLYDEKSIEEISIKTPDLWLPVLFRKKENLSKENLNILNKKYNLYLSPYSSIQINDEKRFITLCPFNPEILLKKYIEINFKYFDYSDVWNTKNIINTLSILYELWDDYDEPAYLYLAHSFLHVDKTIRNLAVEIWIRYTGIGKISNKLLSNTLIKVIENKNVTVKRLTDSIVSQMLNISKNHNSNLEILVKNFILQMDDKPVKGMNKLLQIYKELLDLNKSYIPFKVFEKLDKWEKIKSLNKTVASLKKYRANESG